MPSQPIVTATPWSFRMAKWMMRNGIRGGYRLMQKAASAGWLDCRVRYSLAPGLAIDVPLYRESNRWDRNDVLNYDVPTVTALADAVDRMPAPVVFVDGGADIGVMSALVASRTRNIARFVGVEPNEAAYEVLAGNYAQLPVPAKAVFGALGRQPGRGELQSPDYLPAADHARFIAQKAEGGIPILRIDDLGIAAGQCIVLKLDLEGGELDAIEGAVATLAGAQQFVVDIEAHPKVAQRTGIDPIVILRRLNDLRPCTFRICERADLVLDLGRDFFSQVGGRNFDVIAVSA